MPCITFISLREVPRELESAKTEADLASLLSQFTLWLYHTYQKHCEYDEWAKDVSAADQWNATKEYMPVCLDARDKLELVAAFAAKRRSMPYVHQHTHAHSLRISTVFRQVLSDRYDTNVMWFFSDAWTLTVAKKFQTMMHILLRLVHHCAHPETRVVIGLNQGIDTASIDFSGCHELFREAYKKFYSSDLDVVKEGVKHAILCLKTKKARRPFTIQGNGATHILHVVNLRAGSELLLACVRLLAEAALHDKTEVRGRRPVVFGGACLTPNSMQATFFACGALEAAMRIGEEVRVQAVCVITFPYLSFCC